MTASPTENLSPLADALLEDMVARQDGPMALTRFDALGEELGLPHDAVAVSRALNELGDRGYVENYLRWTVTAKAHQRVALLAKARTPLAPGRRARPSTLAG